MMLTGSYRYCDGKIVQSIPMTENKITQRLFGDDGSEAERNRKCNTPAWPISFRVIKRGRRQKGSIV